MRDIVVLLFLTGCVVAAIKRPWWGVLSLAVFSYMNPHAYAWGFVRSLPVYFILFLVVVVSTFTTKDKQAVPKDWRITTFCLLWMYFLFTTTQSPLQDIAWTRFWFITKIYIPFYFTLTLINTRTKLYYLISTIGISIGVVAVKGGIFAIAKGFSHRVYGPPGTQFEDNNQFAIAMLMVVPLLLVFRRELKHELLKKIILFAVPVIYAAALSSWSRGALLTMIALTFILISNSGRKYLTIPLVLAGAFFVKDYLPDEWFGRMHTMETYEEDQSAMGRIIAWTDGWNYAVSHPFTGCGFEGWMFVTLRDWHSSYVEILAEHGFVAFGLWFSLLAGSLFNLTMLMRKTKGIPELEWVGYYCLMVRASLICYMVGTLFLGLSYWDLLYHLVFIAVLIKKFALEELAQLSATNSGLKKPKRSPAF